VKQLVGHAALRKHASLDTPLRAQKEDLSATRPLLKGLGKSERRIQVATRTAAGEENAGSSSDRHDFAGGRL
jgi:hypothetical protein